MPRSLLLTASAWLAAAVLLGGSGLFARLPPPATGAAVALLCAVEGAALLAVARWRTWALSLRVAPLALFHAWRIVPGAAFLVLHALGLLPRDFAVPAGVGDLVVGLLAPLAARGACSARPAPRAWFLAWNTFGFLELLSVVRSAYRLGTAAPGSMWLLRRLPLSLLPTLLVPITLGVHVLALILFVRGAAAPGGGERAQRPPLIWRAR